MHTKEDVAQLIAHLGELKIEPPVETEISMFGLAAHLHDPVTGQMMTLAQPLNVASGHAEVLLTAQQAAAAVVASRAHHLQTIRGLGYANLEAWHEGQKRKAVARDLAHKQELERTKLETEQSEAVAKAAAENDPNKGAREAARKQEADAAKQPKVMA
jgi:O-glycosyl hydrolase